jgi:phosphoglycolate phosphatase-like HAD superfamily hydrolase
MKSAAPIDSLLFDLDGTLVDSLPGIEYSVVCALELCKVPASNLNLRAIVGPPIRDMLATVSGRTSGAELDALEKAFRTVYDGGAWKRATLYPEVRETLATLAASGMRLFVVTNKPRIPAERILAHLELLPLLTAFCSPDQQGPSTACNRTGRSTQAACCWSATRATMRMRRRVAAAGSRGWNSGMVPRVCKPTIRSTLT